jgi:hypothetical protein
MVVGGRLFEEGVDERRRGVGHQDHVRLVDALPSGDGGTIEHLAVAEQVFIDQPRGNRHVLLLAARVGEAQVRELHLLFLDELENVGRCHIASGKGVYLATPSPHLSGSAICDPAGSASDVAGPVPAQLHRESSS